MNRSTFLLKNTAILSFGTFVPRLVALVTLPVLTGRLSKSDYGTFDLVVSLSSIVLPIATLQLQAAAFRFLVACRGDRRRQSSVLTNMLVVSTIIAAGVLACFCASGLLFTTELRLLISLYLLLDLWVGSLRQAARGLSKSVLFSLSVIVGSISEAAAIFAFIPLFGPVIGSVLLASVAGYCVSLVLLVIGIRLWRFIDIRLLSLGTIGELIRYSWPLIPNTLSSWVISLSDRLIISLAMGVSASAVYAAAQKVPNILGILQSSFGLAWQESASLTNSDSDRDSYYSATFEAFFNLLAGGLAFLIGIGPVLFGLLIRGDYSESFSQMNLLFLGALASGVSTFLGGIYIAHMRTREIGITTACVALVNLFLKIVLIAFVGIVGASISFVVSYAALAIYRAFHVQHFQPMRFHVRRIIFICLALILMVILGSSGVRYAFLINGLAGTLLFVALNRKFGAVLVSRIWSR